MIFKNKKKYNLQYIFAFCQKFFKKIFFSRIFSILERVYFTVFQQFSTRPSTPQFLNFGQIRNFWFSTTYQKTKIALHCAGLQNAKKHQKKYQNYSYFHKKKFFFRFSKTTPKIIPGVKIWSEWRGFEKSAIFLKRKPNYGSFDPISKQKKRAHLLVA